MKKTLFCILACLSFSAFSQENAIPGQKENFFSGGTMAQHGSVESEPYFDSEYDQAGFWGTGRYSFRYNEVMKRPKFTMQNYNDLTAESESKKGANFFETYNFTSEIVQHEGIQLDYDGEIISTSKIECNGSTPVITGKTTFSLNAIDLDYDSYPITGAENQVINIPDNGNGPIKVTVNEVIRNVSGNEATIIRNAIHIEYKDYNEHAAHFYINHSKIEAFCQY